MKIVVHAELRVDTALFWI